MQRAQTEIVSVSPKGGEMVRSKTEPLSAVSEDVNEADNPDGRAESKATETGMTEFLLEASEVETRLRHHILELIEPTISKQAVMTRRMNEMNAFANGCRHDVDDLLSVRDAAESSTAMIEGFRVELASWDKERHEHEQKVSDRLSAQEVEINGLRQSLELLKGVDHTSVTRTLENFGKMLVTYKDENTDLRRFCVERLDLNRDKLAKLRDEFETRMMSVENRMHCLQDVHTQTSMTIKHLEEVVERMDGKVNKSCEDVADLWREKAPVTCLEEQQQDLTEFMKHVNSIASSLKQQFGTLVDDVKAHFETASQVVGKSTADQIDVLRREYEQDLKRINDLRDLLEDCARKQVDGQVKLASDLQSTRETAEAGLSGLGNAIDELRSRRELDQKLAQIEVVQLKKQIHELAESDDDDVGGGGAHHGHHHGNKSDALISLVESCLMSLACDLQDEEDRKRIALFGVRAPQAQPDKGIALPDITLKSKSSPNSAAPSPRRSRTHIRTDGQGNAEGIAPVVSLDTRCLSCSGSQATVLAGFKMACLQYQPGPVDYENKTYSRSELVRKRMELLTQARTSLLGPQLSRVIT